MVGDLPAGQDLRDHPFAGATFSCTAEGLGNILRFVLCRRQRLEAARFPS